MDDKQKTTQESAEAEREKGVALEYDAQDEDALDKNGPAPAPEGGAQG